IGRVGALGIHPNETGFDELLRQRPGLGGAREEQPAVEPLTPGRRVAPVRRQGAPSFGFRIAQRGQRGEWRIRVEGFAAVAAGPVLETALALAGPAVLAIAACMLVATRRRTGITFRARSTMLVAILALAAERPLARALGLLAVRRRATPR